MTMIECWASSDPYPDLELRQACIGVLARRLVDSGRFKLVPRPTDGASLREALAWVEARKTYGRLETARDRHALICAVEREVDSWSPSISYALAGLIRFTEMLRARVRLGPVEGRGGLT